MAEANVYQCETCGKILEKEEAISIEEAEALTAKSAVRRLTAAAKYAVKVKQRNKMPRRHPPTRFIISRRRVRMVIGRIRKPGEKVSARPQKPRLGRFTQGVSATISMLAMD